jgi:hypothetical protein
MAFPLDSSSPPHWYRPWPMKRLRVTMKRRLPGYLSFIPKSQYDCMAGRADASLVLVHHP